MHCECLGETGQLCASDRGTRGLKPLGRYTPESGRHSSELSSELLAFAVGPQRLQLWLQSWAFIGVQARSLFGRHQPERPLPERCRTGVHSLKASASGDFQVDGPPAAKQAGAALQPLIARSQS